MTQEQLEPTREHPGCQAGGETPAALAESLERYRRIVETTQEGIWEMDGQFVTTYVNRQMAALLGYEPAEMLGRPVTDFMLPAELDDHQAKMERRQRGIHERYERQFRRRDGSSCWMLVSATALQDAQGNFAGSFAMLTDITARKQAEAALRQSEARYRELFEDASVGIFQSLPEGRYRVVNRAFAAMFGYDSPAQMVAEVTDIAAQLYASAEDRARVSRLLLEQGTLVNHEVRLRRRDGTPFWGSINATVVYDEQGQVQYYYGTLINITERKQAEEALRASESRFRSLVESMDDIVFTLDREQRHTGVFGRWIERLGVTPNHFLGKTAREILGPEAAAVHEAAAQRALAGEPTVYEWSVPYPTGTLEYQTSLSPLRDVTGAIVGVVGVGRDVTAWKRAEHALRERERIWELQAALLLQLMTEGALLQGDIRRAIEKIMEAGAAMVGTARVSVWLYAADYTLIRCFDLYERDEARHSAGEELCSAEFPAYVQAHRQGRVIAAADVYADPRTCQIPAAYYQRYQICSLLDAPIWLHDRVGGLLSFEQTQTPRQWTSEDERVAITLATLVALSFEIGERRQAEAALYESEARQRQILEAVPVAIVLSRVEDGTILYANHYASSLFGLPVAELVGRSMVDLYGSVADQQRLLQELAQQGRVRDYEFRVRRLDQGTGRWVSLAVQPFSYQGVPVWLSSLVDITDRKQAEQEREQLLVQLWEQAQQRQQIINTVPEGILLLVADETRQYRVQLANLLGEKDLTFLAQGRVGEYLLRLGGQPLARFLTSPPKGLWHELEYGGRIFQLIARSLQDQPTNGSWVLVIRDITQQRDTERRMQQQERLAAVGQLAAGIAHDFNNILAVIGLYAQLMVQDTALSPRVRERLAIINQEAQHASRLIQQILDFSRQTVLERRPLDLLPLFKEQLKILERTLPESIRLSLVHAADTYMVNGDPTRLQQLLMNLALNARDAMPEGGELRFVLERLTITAAQCQGRAPLPPLAVPFPVPLPPELTAGEWIRLTVADTGVGLSPEAQAHLFQPFFTTKEPGKGTGLGLAQVHGIVGAHEGYIVAATHPRQAGQPGGTAFVIYLPALVVPAAGETLAAPADLPAGHGELVLVVEDNAAARAALVDSLTALGYRAVTASDGLQALEFLQRAADQIVLVLSDVVMPELGGLGLLRAMYRQGYRIGVILLTGHPLQQELEQLRGEGDPAVQALLIDWLLKPPALEQLAQTLAQALAGQR